MVGVGVGVGVKGGVGDATTVGVEVTSGVSLIAGVTVRVGVKVAVAGGPNGVCVGVYVKRGVGSEVGAAVCVTRVGVAGGSHGTVILRSCAPHSPPHRAGSRTERVCWTSTPHTGGGTHSPSTQSTAGLGTLIQQSGADASVE